MPPITMPYDLATEQSVLGSVILRPSLAGTLFTLLGPAAFYAHGTRHIYEAMLDLHIDGIDINEITIVETLRRSKRLEAAGGEAAVSQLVDEVATTTTIEPLCRILLDKQARREAVTRASRIAHLAADLSTDLAEVERNADGLAEAVVIGRERAGGAEYKRARLVRASDLEGVIRSYHEHGMTNRGVDIGWNHLGGHYRLAKRFLHIITGIPQSGKSSWFDCVMVNTARHSGWKWCVFSPEYYPFEIHFRSLSEKYLAKEFFRMTEVDLEQAMEWIDTHFIFVEPQDDTITLDQLLRLYSDAIKDCRVDGVSLDPWNEIAVDKVQEREVDYLERGLRRCRWFARRNNVAFVVIGHPTKQTKGIDGTYNVVNLYDMAGGAHWYNKADTGITVHRVAGSEFTEVHITKLKFPRLHSDVGLGHLRLQHSAPVGYILPSQSPPQKQTIEDIRRGFLDD